MVIVDGVVLTPRDDNDNNNMSSATVLVLSSRARHLHAFGVPSFSSRRGGVFFCFQYRRKSLRFIFPSWPRALGFRWRARCTRATCRWTWRGWRTAARCTAGLARPPWRRSTRTPPYWPWTTCHGPTRATIRAWPPTRCTAPRTPRTWTSTVPQPPLFAAAEDGPRMRISRIGGGAETWR